MEPLSESYLRSLIAASLEEDLAFGPDVTTLATISADATSRARFVSRAEGVTAGLDVIRYALDTPGCEVTQRVDDGERVAPGNVLAEVTAPTRTLLTTERTMLNILSHASGIATATRRWVDAVEGTGARIRDTRKTLPGLRELQKYAVRAGGGVNHRMGLGDAAMIKDNHVAAVSRGVVAALAAVRAHAPDLPCEVEVDTLDQLDALLRLSEPPQLVLLDNFSVADTAEAVRRRDQVAPGCELESSGGLTLERARAYAETGVAYLAVGALTHSVSALDIGLDYLGD
ncbi:carboxylating nicotinate-nucleotide diphosphorylase [Corynebacterium sanguinis]|uniref:Nicotinate-nucleotide pyrophosphorylase [carboxylating] n=1 Tax=Corynebacterium sanguinis TaxID=2594913 RepID=A0A6C1TVQ7_9CORY|nr:carboxylating nicotinate-nucleotide diphosphorylase [Corynebacterium sanguinis]MBA4504680.1 carboxylating nicotinate-nucleotide diphosphorylase [Corynebacterium sanguinis]MCT1411585.1 carboxylating nicotinate-nucleotide diphosphorylase [Corynebacterium sanguinis]MCT1443694.1 carboxylating nicotinate-nucleotide diphosphorylase [Corynebacterium sanguinis]MCT1463120.1 carboxylating nicotinate-nucleotide diphosphorylase [Corynebacterium sanguinis]MCT1663486.1 carboxylating nicotinate-nucleotide